MKKLILITAIGFGTFLSLNSIQAADNRTEQNVGFGSGLLIGAIAGGPVGAIIGAATGAWLGDQVNEAEKVQPLNEQIAQNKVYLHSMEERLSQQHKSLDQARLLLAEQQAIQLRVSRNKQLITELQVDLMFRTNSTQLASGAKQKITPLVLMLEQFPQLELQLTGHGDILGTEDGNTQVAYERTLTVQQAFIDAGIDSQRIHLLNSGRTLAEASIEDVDGRALDRRVRIRFTYTTAKSSLALK